MGFKVEFGEDNVPFIQLEQYQLRLDLEELDEEFKERARLELGETDETVENALETFTKMLKHEKGLYVPLDDRKYLIKFLRPFKYNCDKAFKVFKKYYKYKNKYPDYYTNLTPEGVRHVYDNEVFVFLPARTPSGARILIMNLGKKWNPDIVSLRDMYRALMIAIEIAMLEPKTQVGGVHVILNMDGFGLTHVCQFSPQFARLLLVWVQECSPTRLNGIHIVNQSILLNMVWTIFKPFIGQRLRNKIFFHGTNNSALLSNKIPSSSLPKYLGGESLECPGKLLSDMFYYYEAFFKEHASYGYTNENILEISRNKTQIERTSD